MIAIGLSDVSEIAGARRSAVAMAQGAGFNEEEAGRVAIVATELSTNLVRHGGGGEILASLYEDVTGSGLELIAIDKGPGISSLDDALRDGFSTGGSSGHGLGAVRRQSHAFEVFSRPGLGTAILARLTPGRPGPSGSQGPRPLWGAVCVPMPGEEACGDAWCSASEPAEGHCTFLVVDGLGHGPNAAAAAVEAVRLFRRHQGDHPAAILEAMHAGLRPTRGAAVSITRLDPARRRILFAGIGNVAGAFLDDGGLHRMVSHNGTAGHTARRIQAFEYPFTQPPLIVMHSDGVSGNFSLGAYPGLAAAHPSLIAAVLYRDFGRRRDDATVLVAGGCQ